MADPRPASSRPSVLAVVVTDGLTPYLAQTLRGLAEQRLPPAAVLLVDVTSAEDLGHVRGSHLRSVAHDAGLPLESVRVVQAPAARTLGAAVREGLTRLATQGSGGAHLARATWLWLLHDDSAPERDALAELVRVGDAGTSIAVVGPKQRDWDAPEEIVSLGVTISPGGRRFTGIEDGELDQGQHDGREDVYAVGTAGALVAREVWELLGGPDPALGPFGDGLDLSRRARLAGYRVVVAPAAVVRHARAAFFGLRGPGTERGRAEDGDAGAGGAEAGDAAPRPADVRRSFRGRRAALLHARLVDASAWTLLVLVVAVPLAALLRALARIVTKEPRLAGDEIVAAAGVLVRPGALRRARRRARRTRQLSPRRLRPLRASWRQVWRVGHDRRLNAAALRRARREPSELEKVELAALARRRRSVGTTTLLLLLAAAAVAFGPLLVAGPLTGGALLPASADLGGVWHAATSGWIESADGHPGPPDPFLGVLAVLSLPTGASAQVAVATLVLGSIPLAGLGAWFAAGAATRSLGLRAWAAAVWAFAPALLLGAGQGRLGAVVAHVALPWVALAVARALGVNRRDEVAVEPGPDDTDPERQQSAPAPVSGAAGRRRARTGSPAAAAAGGLALAVAVAGAPVLLPVALGVLLLLALLARARRRYLVLVAIPPVTLLLPLVVEALREPAAGTWRVLLAEPGVPLAAAPVDAYVALLTWPAEPVPWPVLPDAAARIAPLVVGGLLVVAALLALGRVRSWRGVQAGWVVAVAGLLAAAGAARVFVGAGTGLGDQADVVQAVRGWAGPGTSVVLLGLLLAILAGGDGLRARLVASAFGWRQVAVTLLAVLLVAGPVLGAVAWSWRVVAERGTDDAREVVLLTGRAATQVPALGAEIQRAPQRASVLALSAGADALDVRLWRADGDQLTERSVVVVAREVTGVPGEVAGTGPDAADAELAELAGRLASGSRQDESTALAAHGVAVVLVPPGSGAARDRLVARLDATAGLERVTENETGVVWRVALADGPQAAARVRVLDAGGTVLQTVPAVPGGARGAVDAGEAGRRVVLAERANPSWRAWLDGEPLRPAAVGWQQAFDLDTSAGTLVVAYDDWPLTILHTVQAVVLGLFVLLALPLRRRRPERD